MILGIPEDALLREANQRLALSLAGLGILAVLALAAAWIGGDVFILRPVKVLAKATARLAAGDLSVRTGLSPQQGELGQVAHAFDEMVESLTRRVAERQQAEDALRESEARYRAFIDATSDMVFVKDDRFRYLIANEAQATFFGKEQMDVIDKTDFELMPAYAAEICRASDLQALQTQSVIGAEEQLGDRTYEATKFPVPLQGDKAGVGGIIRDVTDRKRAEAALRDKVAALQTLAEIDREISAASELQVILDLVCRRATALLRVPKSAIALMRASPDDMEMVSSDGLRDPKRTGEEFAHDWQAGIVRRSDLRSYGVVSQADIPTDTPYMPEFRAREEVRALALAPLVAGEQALGALLIFDTVPHPWSADEIQLLGLLAGQAAIGIEKARLYDALSQEKARLELLYGLHQQISTSLDVHDVAQQALDQMCALVGAQYGVLLTTEPGRDGRNCLRLAAASGYDNTSVEALDKEMGRLVQEGLEGWVAAHRQSVLLDDVRKDPRWVSAPGRHYSVRSALSVPLMARGELMSVFTLMSDREACFNKEHLKVAESVASVVAAALANARLYQGEHEQRALAEALRDTAAALVSTLDFDQVLDRILTYVGHVVAHDAGTILLVEQGIAAIARSRGYAERGLASVGEIWFPVAERANLRSMSESGRPLVILDTRAYPDWVDLPETHWIRSYVAAPIQVKGQVVGFINLDSAVPGAFTQTHAEHLQAFADQAAIAIENAELYSSLQESNQQLRKALRAKDEMIQNVSHELRTPLAILTGYAELLETADLGALTSEQEQAIQIIHQQGDQLRFMVDQLLALQAFNARAMQRIELDMEAWLQRTLRPWAARAALRELAADLRIRLEIEPGLPCVLADPQLLAQVIDNLLANAVKFSPAGGEVWVRAWADAGEVIIAVSDTGIGIPPDKLDQVFERFYQVDGGATRQFRGLGIGLALCRAIVEAHGGRIWAESAGVGQGSTFYVALESIAVCGTTAPDPQP